MLTDNFTNLVSSLKNVSVVTGRSPRMTIFFDDAHRVVWMEFFRALAVLHSETAYRGEAEGTFYEVFAGKQHPYGRFIKVSGKETGYAVYEAIALEAFVVGTDGCAYNRNDEPARFSPMVKMVKVQRNIQNKYNVAAAPSQFHYLDKLLWGHKFALNVASTTPFHWEQAAYEYEARSLRRSGLSILDVKQRLDALHAEEDSRYSMDLRLQASVGKPHYGKTRNSEVRWAQALATQRDLARWYSDDRNWSPASVSEFSYLVYVQDVLVPQLLQ